MACKSINISYLKQLNNAQMIANGASTEFNLLKTRKTTVFEVIREIKFLSILILTPPPLDYRRQEYLYHNIRPFVRDEFKDIKVLLNNKFYGL